MKKITYLVVLLLMGICFLFSGCNSNSDDTAIKTENYESDSSSDSSSDEDASDYYDEVVDSLPTSPEEDNGALSDEASEYREEIIDDLPTSPDE